MKIEVTSTAVTKKGIVYIQAKVTCGMKKEDIKNGDKFQCTKEEDKKEEKEKQ
jgi:hypothetical protein